MGEDYLLGLKDGLEAGFDNSEKFDNGFRDDNNGEVDEEPVDYDESRELSCVECLKMFKMENAVSFRNGFMSRERYFCSLKCLVECLKPLVSSDGILSSSASDGSSVFTSSEDFGKGGSEFI